MNQEKEFRRDVGQLRGISRDFEEVFYAGILEGENRLMALANVRIFEHAANWLETW